MTPEKFTGHNIVFAKDQPEYIPLPAHIDHRRRGAPTTFCWRLTWRERFTLLVTGRVWHQVLTFDAPLQPQLLLVEKPDLEKK